MAWSARLSRIIELLESSVLAAWVSYMRQKTLASAGSKAFDVGQRPTDVRWSRGAGAGTFMIFPL
jgi:hypothetical protein